MKTPSSLWQVSVLCTPRQIKCTIFFKLHFKTLHIECFYAHHSKDLVPQEPQPLRNKIRLKTKHHYAWPNFNMMMPKSVERINRSKKKGNTQVEFFRCLVSSVCSRCWLVTRRWDSALCLMLFSSQMVQSQVWHPGWNWRDAGGTALPVLRGNAVGLEPVAGRFSPMASVECGGNQHWHAAIWDWRCKYSTHLKKRYGSRFFSVSRISVRCLATIETILKR